MVFAGAGEAGAVHESRESDSAFHDGSGIRALESHTFCAVVRQLERSIEQAGHVDWIPHDLADRAGLPGLNEIAAAQLLRRKIERPRNSIHVPFEREDA